MTRTVAAVPPSLRSHARRRAAWLPLVLLAACTPDAAVPELDHSIVVRLAPVSSDSARPPITATGILGARDVVTLGFKIGGVVASIPVDVGDRVARGQVIARLDTREIDALVDKATAAFDKALRDSARVARLYTDSVATIAQWQDASTALAAARADLAAARVNQQYAVITAPDAGAVLQRWLQPGATVGVGAPVLTVGGTGRGVVFRAGLADRDLLRVRLGAPAEITLDAMPGRTLRGRVVQRAAAADPRTGAYLVEVAVDGAADLPDGLAGTLRVQPSAGIAGQVLPLAALLEADGDSATLWSVQDGRARRHRVGVGPLVGSDRVLVTGLDGIDAVVVTGAAYLTEGAAVRIGA